MKEIRAGMQKPRELMAAKQNYGTKLCTKVSDRGKVEFGGFRVCIYASHVFCAAGDYRVL